MSLVAEKSHSMFLLMYFMSFFINQKKKSLKLEMEITNVMEHEQVVKEKLSKNGVCRQLGIWRTQLRAIIVAG